MKKFTLLSFIFFSELLLNNPVLAQWIRTVGPYGGVVACMVVNDTTVYAGTYNGLFQSANNGESWIAKNKGLKDLITAVAISGSDIFAGTWVNGIYLSTDDGNTWSSINHGLPKNFGTASLVFCGNDLFLGARFSGVFLSSDKGKHWKPFNTGLTDSLSILTLSVADSNILAGTDHGIFLSTNKGKSWKAMNSGLPTDVGVHAIVVLDSLIYLGTDYGVFRSDDNGKNWLPFRSGLPDYSKIFSLVVLGNNLYAGTRSDGIYVMPNNKNAWKAVNTGLPLKTEMGITSLAVSGTNLFAGTNNVRGIYLSANQGKTWHTANVGLRSVFMNAVIGTGPDLLAGGDALFLSGNKGNAWDYIMNTFQITSLVKANKNIYAACGQGLLRSTDNGKDWQLVLNVLSTSGLAASDSNVFVATAYNLYLSNNYGNSWKKLKNSALLPDNTLTDCAAIAGLYYLLGTNRGVYYSNDNGKNWVPATGLPEQSSISDFAVSGTKVYAALMSGHGVYLSENNGQSWRHVGPDSTSNYLIRSLGVMDTVVLAASYSHGLFLLTENGNHWTSISAGLPDDSFINSMCDFDSEIYVAIGFDGLWHRPISDILTDVHPFSRRSSFLQLKNYPNPFREETNITYSQPVAGRVNLTVYNSIGQKVITLVDKQQEAGDYSVKWDGLNSPEGVYFYKISVEGYREYSQTKKMILIK